MGHTKVHGQWTSPIYIKGIRSFAGLFTLQNLKKVVKFQAPLDLLKETARLGRLPVVNFAAGGLATPADCSLLMQLGVDGCFVGSGIFKR